MRSLVTSFLAVLLASQAAWAETSPPLMTLLRVNCDGSQELGPTTPVGMSLKLPIFRNAITSVFDTLKGRAECACDEASSNSIRDVFDPIQALLYHNQAEEVKSPLDSCLMDTFPKNLGYLDVVRISLPDSCSYGSWVEDGTCFIQHPFPALDVSLQLGIFKCPNSFFPGFSLTCDGEGCNNFGMPCRSSEDCSAPLTCFDIGDRAGLHYDELRDAIFQGFKQAYIYDDGDESPGCWMAKRGDDESAPDNDIMTNALTFAAQTYWGWEDTVFNEIKLCGVGELANFDGSVSGPEDTFIGNATATVNVVGGYPEICLFPEEAEAEEIVDELADKYADLGGFHWVNVLPLVNDPCPSSNQPTNCPNSWGGGGGGWNQNDDVCYGHYLIEAMFPYDLRGQSGGGGGGGGGGSSKSTCFPNPGCDLDPVYDDSVLSSGEFDFANLLFEICSFPRFSWNGAFNEELFPSQPGTFLDTCATVKVLMGAGVTKWDFTKFTSAIRSVYQQFSEDEEGLVDNTAREEQWNYVQQFAASLTNIYIPLQSDEFICREEGYAEEDLMQHLSNSLRNYQNACDQDNNTFVTQEEQNSCPFNTDSSTFDGIVGLLVPAYYWEGGDIATSDVHELIFSPLVHAVFALTDGNDDEWIDHQEMQIAQSLFGTLQSYPWTSNWPTNVTLSAQQDRVGNLGSVFDEFAINGVIPSFPSTDAGDSEELLFSMVFEFLASRLSSSWVTAVRSEEFFSSFQQTFSNLTNGTHELTASDLVALYEEYGNQFGTWEWGVTRIATLFFLLDVPSLDYEDFYDSLPVHLRLYSTARFYIEIPNLESWDGVNSAEVEVHTIPHVIPHPEPTLANTLFEFSCAQQVIFPSHNSGLFLNSHFTETLNHAVELLKELQACRSAAEFDNKATFLTRFGAWTPYMWLNLLDDQGVNFALPDESDWLRQFFNEDQTANIRISNLPSSCTFQRYVNDGVCEFVFEGIKTLFQIDASIKFTAQTCPGDSLFSSFTIQCIGAGCPFLHGLTPCSNTCNGGLVCQDFLDVFTYIMQQIKDKENDGSGGPEPTGSPEGPGDSGSGSESGGSGPLDFLTNRTFLEDVLFRTDMVRLVLAEDNPNATFCTPPEAFMGGIGFIGSSPQEQCFGPSQWSADVQRIILSIFGAKIVDATNTAFPKFRYCLPPKATFNLDAIEEFGESLVSVEGVNVYLNPNIFKSTLQGPTTPPSSAPTNAPPIPTCRCNAFCGNYAYCANCYSAGGMVLPNAPNFCFCKSTNAPLNNQLVANYNPANGLLCANPPPTCSDCQSCHPSCSSCFNPGLANGCLGCSNSSHVYVTETNNAGAITSGRCYPPCNAGQYRKSNGICVWPDCTANEHCNGNGQCVHSFVNNRDYCKCNQGYLGLNCTQTPDCSAHGACNGNGVCIHNQYFRTGQCVCQNGFTGPGCNIETLSFSPTTTTELGGGVIVLSRGNTFTNNPICRFSFDNFQVDVPGVVDGSNAKCIIPMFPFSGVGVIVSASDNGGAFLPSSTLLNVRYSGSLFARDAAGLDALLWDVSESKDLQWDPTVGGTNCFGAEDLSITITMWEWDQFEDEPNDPAVASSTTVTLASGVANNGSEVVSFNSFTTFDWASPLYVISIGNSGCAIRRYVVPVQDSVNYDDECDAWETADNELGEGYINGLRGCTPSLFSVDPFFRAHPDCNRNNGASFPSKNCFPHEGAGECLIPGMFDGNYGGRYCCFNSNTGAPVAGQTARYITGPGRQWLLVKHFSADILPRYICCHKSNNCDAYNGNRPEQPTPWVPPALGGTFGDPHFITLDGKFWTFNAFGEFVLIEHNETDFIMQGRLTPLSESSEATILTAVAIQDVDGDLVEVYQDLEQGEEVYFIINDEFVENVPVDTPYVTSTLAIEATSAYEYTITFSSGVKVDISSELGTFSAYAYLPASFVHRVRGLLGNWDGNSSNDFRLRNGTTLLSTSSEETLFFNFGQHYATDAGSSLFSYPDGKDWSDYNDPEAIPSFEGPQFANPTLQAQAEAACSSAPDVNACLYDVAQTGNVRAAHISLKSGAVFQSFSSAINQPPVFNSPPTNVNVKYQQNVQINYDVSDPEEQDITLNLVTGPFGGTLDSGASRFTFTVTSALFLSAPITPLEVRATDSAGGVSDSVVTEFTIVYSTCADGVNAVVAEGSLELAAYCLASTCSDTCAGIVKRLMALEDCQTELRESLGESFSSARAKCCQVDQDIGCTDENTGGLSQEAIIGIAVGCSVGGLILIAIIAFFVVRSVRASPGAGEEREMQKMRM